MALCSLDHHGFVVVGGGSAAAGGGTADLQWKEGYTLA